MGKIMEALHRLNELDSTSNKFKRKLQFPNFKLSDENELDDAGNPINVNDNPNEEPIYKKKRLAAGYIYVLTQADPITYEPDMRLCKIGYAKDTDVRLANFNGDTSNSSPNIDWYARVPIYFEGYTDKEGKPSAKSLEQFDKRIHAVIDTVTEVASNHMKTNRGATQDIDLRIANANTSKNKEWFRMSPKDAVRVLSTILETSEPLSMYGKIELNTEHKYYDPNITRKSYSDKGVQTKKIKTTGVDRTGTTSRARVNLLNFMNPGDKLTFNDGDADHIAAMQKSDIVVNSDGNLVWNNMTFNSPTGLRNYLISEVTKDRNHHNIKPYDSFFFNGTPIRQYIEDQLKDSYIKQLGIAYNKKHDVYRVMLTPGMTSSVIQGVKPTNGQSWIEVANSFIKVTYVSYEDMVKLFPGLKVEDRTAAKQPAVRVYFTGDIDKDIDIIDKAVNYITK